MILVTFFVNAHVKLEHILLFNPPPSSVRLDYSWGCAPKVVQSLLSSGGAGLRGACHPSSATHRWLSWRSGTLAEVNDRMLEIKSLEVTTKIYQQQIRQRLKYEFPEIADRAIGNSRTSEGYTAWIGWLAGIHAYTRIQNERKKSIATILGIKITQFTRDHAAAIAANQMQEARLKSQLADLLFDSCFDRYRPIFDNFGFGYMMQATIVKSDLPD